MNRPIMQVAEELGLASDHVLPHGRGAAKVALDAISEPKGKLVMVSAITPTPAGEGKTTTSVALAMGLRRVGTRAVVALREPSLGPVFGIKGGGTGGGRATVEPSDRINLHFTGDIHAIGSAHNLLAAIVDNAIHFSGTPDARRVLWPRVMDMNDRSLRQIVIGLGGHGAPRETRFDITAASEVMAVLCLAESHDDLRERLGRIVIAGKGSEFTTAADLDAHHAMAALLIDALSPNLAQTADGGPALVHGGPFANIAHGCSSVLGTRLGLAHADVTVTEGGFGFDLGGEKLLDIKCRGAGLWPDAAVLVVTLRALKMHGGAKLKEASAPNAEALAAGISNLDAHLDAARGFGLSPVIAMNHFTDDPQSEIDWLRDACKERGVRFAVNRGFADGAEGAVELAEAVNDALTEPKGEPRFTYPLEAPLRDKVEAIATKIYGADGIVVEAKARRALKRFEKAGYGNLPVCIAKTFRSISDNEKLLGRPRGFTATLRDARLSAGAGFVVGLLGDVMTMPGLPRRPAAADVRVDESGNVRGLMRSE